MSNKISIDVIFNAINKTGSVFGSVNKGLTGLTTNLWKVNQTADLLGRASDALNQIGAPGKEFDFGLAEMSAITGTTGSELTDLGNIARKVGKESGLGASASLEAFKLLASQIEVDKIGMKGLIDLQDKTITLAQASPKLGMEGAANALAGTINQFGLEANQANRVMNVLAAGSKYGAAEIPDLAQSFKVVGASAAAAGLDVETTAGAIEVLSKNNLKGSEAGTALRNVLLKMQTDLGFDFKVTKLSDALGTLQGKEGDAAYMAKLFGAENIAAAQFLVKNAQAVDEMTQKVTGTTVATEQAAIMNQTWVHKADVFKAKLNDLAIGFSQSNAGLLSMVQMGGQAAMTITALSPVVGFFGKGIMGIGSLTGGAITGMVKIYKATKLMNYALAAGKLATYSALIERYGMAGRLAAAGIWVKNQAVAFGVLVGKLFNAESRASIILQTRQAIASKLQAAWTWVVTRAQLVGSGITSLWGKRMLLTGAIQAGWSKIMALSSLTMKGLFGSFTGIIAQTWAWTAALLANPITWVVGGVIALVAGIALAWKYFDGFRGVLVGAWEGMKAFGDILVGTVLGGLKQLLAGIGKIGKAISLLFKGEFKEAGKTAMEGFGDIGKSAIKMSPIGVAVETIKRKDEVVNAASAGYAKGKNMDTSNFLNFGSKKDHPGIEPPMQGNRDKFQRRGIEQGLTAADLQKAGQPGMWDMQMPGMEAMKVPGMLDMETPAMKQAKLQGKIVNMATPQPELMQMPGMWNMQQMPGMEAMQVPGMLDMETPAMKQAKLQGKIVNMATPQPELTKVPGMWNMQQMPGMEAMQVPGMLDMETPAMKQAKLQGKIVNMATPQPELTKVPGMWNMQQMPGMDAMPVPGMLDMETPAMKQINLTGKLINLYLPDMGAVQLPGTAAEAFKRPSYNEQVVKQNNIDELGKNITQNVATTTTNQNTSNKASKIEINYQPQVHISANMTQENQDDLMKILTMKKDQLVKLVKEELRKEGRLSYAG